MRLLSKTNINFISKQKVTSFLSIALIISGIVSLIIKGGPFLSIDFTGGTVAQVKFDKDVELITEIEGTTIYELPKNLLGIIWKGKSYSTTLH